MTTNTSPADTTAPHADDAPALASASPYRTLLELAPLLVFFAINWVYGLMAGTVALMIGTGIAIVISYLLEKRVPIMPLIGTAGVMVFGGLTLFFEDETFIKIKPTVVNVIFGVGLLGGLAFGRSLLKPLFGSVFELTEAGWRILTLRWGLFFLFLAVLNEIVWRGFSSDTWVNFKVFGVFPITIAFAMLQLPVMMKHQIKPSETGPDRAEQP